MSVEPTRSFVQQVESVHVNKEFESLQDYGSESENESSCDSEESGGEEDEIEKKKKGVVLKKKYLMWNLYP